MVVSILIGRMMLGAYYVNHDKLIRHFKVFDLIQ